MNVYDEPHLAVTALTINQNFEGSKWWLYIDILTIRNSKNQNT